MSDCDSPDLSSSCSSGASSQANSPETFARTSSSSSSAALTSTSGPLLANLLSNIEQLDLDSYADAPLTPGFAMVSSSPGLTLTRNNDSGDGPHAMPDGYTMQSTSSPRHKHQGFHHHHNSTESYPDLEDDKSIVIFEESHRKCIESHGHPPQKPLSPSVPPTGLFPSNPTAPSLFPPIASTQFTNQAFPLVPDFSIGSGALN